jgi:thiol-disulfide isomerase/thioredoxin
MASGSAVRARKRAAQRKKAAAKKSGLPIFWIAIGVVLVLFAAAIVMTRSDSETPASSGAADIQETRAVSVTGDALPQFEEEGDAAIGQEMPAIEGKSFDGEDISIANDGRPKMVLLLAHWCSVCQQEVPVVQEWIDGSGMPEGVDLYSIATSTSEGQGNYPPSDWLEREAWSLPVMADSAQYEASDALGLTAFPFFVFVNSDGTVAQRVVGAQSAAQIAQAISQLN